jgi:hypothetical protein
MSPTAVSVTEAPPVDLRGSAAGLGAPPVVRVTAGLAEPVAPTAGDAAVPRGEPAEEQAAAASTTAGTRTARSLLRRMRLNLAPDVPACGDVEPAGGSGRYMVTSVDKEALRRRYAEERDKRLRPDGNDQYLRLADELARYLDDPHTPWTERAPGTDHRTVVCVGGGFAGLVVGARLREAGVDVRIIEKGGDFGGTWYWNRYPGAQCDTASIVYLPLLEETGHMPTEKYVHGPEILAHCQHPQHHQGE